MPAFLEGFPRERTWLLPALAAVQRAEGWLSAEALAAVAGHLRVPLSEVWGVATHYPELRLTRPGRALVRVCTGLSCRVAGGLTLLETLEHRLGLRAGATSADGAATLETMDCAFACGVAPVVAVGHRLRGRVDVGDLDAVLAGGPGEDGETVPDDPENAPPAVRGSPTARLAALARVAEERAPASLLAVGLGTCGRARGAAETLAALRTEVTGRRLPYVVAAAGCNGMCWAAPVVTARLADGATRVAAGVTPRQVGPLLDALERGDALGALAAEADWFRPQARALLARCGLVDAGDVADAVRAGAYRALARALEEGRPARVIDEVRQAGLAGRGGAYFQTAVKWAGCRDAAGTPKFVVVNGEEGEPGIFKDRHLMEGDPHLVLEGLLLAAFAAGASRAVVYIHGEADLSASRMARALGEARQWGLVGARVLGTDFSLEVEIRRGLGGFVLGEETALLESIEGRRAMPRTRPPFPVESGLWGQPTVINNVETLCAVPGIVERGGAWFAGLGGGHGPKLFGLSGHVRRPGLVEMEVGCTLRSLIEGVGGGSATGRPIRAAVVGGPSGSVVHPRSFDEPLVPRGRLSPGTGGVVALDATASVRDAVKTLLAFNARESCGKCTPCREGTARLLAMLEGPVGLGEVKDLAEVIQVASLCGLGQAAPLAVLSGIAGFPEEFGRVP